MALQLPSLTKDGAVTFAAAADLEQAWATVAKGALAVRPERPLAPLEHLEVYVMCPGLTSPIMLRVEVVSLQPERALLRLLEPAPSKPSLAPPGADPVLPPLEIVVDAAPKEREIAVDELPTDPTPHPPLVDGGREIRVDNLPPMPPREQPFTDAAVPNRASRTQELDRIMPAPGADDAMPRFETPLPMTSPIAVAAPAPELQPAKDRAKISMELIAPIVEPVAAPVPKPVEVFAESERPPKTAPILLQDLFEPAVAPVAGADMGAPTPAPVPVPVMPPVFAGDTLRFTSATDLRGARSHLESVGALLAVADAKLPVNAVEITITVADRVTKAKAKVTLSAAAPGTAVVQAVEKGGFKLLLAELDATTAPVPSPTSAIPTGGTPAHGIPAVGPRGFALPRQGQLTNPTTAEGILALPLTRQPTEAELLAPAVPLLLRWLRTQKGVQRLEVTADDHPVFTAVFCEGREVRTPASLTTLGKSLALPRMTYTIMELGRPPSMTTTGRTLHLTSEVIRGLCSHCTVEDLARAFPRRPMLCPRAITDVVSGLGLSAQATRFVKTDVGGTQYVDEIARAAVGARTVWETLYILELYNGLSWDEPPPNKKDRTGPVPISKDRTGTFEVNADEIAWAPFEGKDHFQVLGLHWSSSPNEVPPAYQKLRSDYGTAGIRRPKNAQLGDKIMKRLDEAFKVLSDGNARRAYRREKYNLVWAHQAQLLVQKAKLAIYRKDAQEALNALLAAEDIAPSEEARALLASMTKKAGG